MSKDDFFAVKTNIGKVEGFSRYRDEGADFWLGGMGQQIRLGLSDSRIRKVLIMVVLIMGLIWSRLFWLQVVKGREYQIIAEENRVRLEIIKAERGIIYDRYGKALVENVPRMYIYFTPADLPKDSEDRKELAQKLESLVGKNKEEILDQFNQTSADSYKTVLLAEDLNNEQAIMFKVAESDLPGVQLKTEYRRQYLEGSGLSHALGYVGRINQEEFDSLSDKGYGLNDFIGKDGIEVYYEDILRGQDGVREMEVDAFGRPKKILNQQLPLAGANIVLTVDLELQKKLTESLKKAIIGSGTKGGAVGVAIDPNSGEVLALVSLPGFDNNFFSAGIQRDAYDNYLTDPARPLFNRAISGSYPPGSTFKPVVAMAALEQGLIDESKTFLSVGGISVGAWFFPDWKYGGHGRINVVKALAESVNTFFYYIGGGYSDFEGLGVDRITDYASRFGLGKKLGIDLPGEAGGFLPSKSWKEEAKQEPWYIGDTYHLAIGQGDVLVTPLQVAEYTAVIANGGILYRPHLFKESIGSNRVEAEGDYIIKKDFLKDENIEVVRKGLRSTVLSGSARSLQVLPVTVAGKTGTAQVGGDKETHAWFTGFAPYENSKIVLTVLVENGGGGDVVAVPVFREVMEWYFSDR